MFRDLKSNPTVNQLLVLLLCTDGLLIVVHLLHWETAFFHGEKYAIWREGGIGEMFQYMKEFWLTIIFLYAGLKRANPMLIMWSLIFFYFLADDALRWHEDMGRVVANLIGLPALFGLAPQIQGQVVYAVGLAVIFFGVVGVLSYLRGREALVFSAGLFVLLGLFAVFAVLLDWVFHLFEDQTIRHYLVVIEEGGEMLVLSLIVWFVLTSLQKEPSGMRS